jgi:ribonuclease P protein component
MRPAQPGSLTQTRPHRRQTMRRANRLTASEDFQRARREGQSWANRYVVLCAVANSLGQSRFGFAVGKRIGKATARNRARRLLREAIRLRLHEIEPGWDVVLIARAAIREADFSTIDRAVEQLLQRTQLLQSAEET